MAFGILIRNPDSFSVGAFETLLEDTSYALVQGKPEIDWSNAQSIDAGFGKRPPKAVINWLPHNLAINDIYFSELAALLEVCIQRKIALLHVSHYRVYGKAWNEKGWRETDDVEPDDELGHKLLEIEKLLATHTRHIILRPGWVLEGEGGILDRFIPPMLSKQELVVSDHHFGSPISRSFIVRVLFAMIQQVLCGAENWGAFNIHSSDKCSEAEFADQLYRLLVNEFKLDVSVPIVAGPKDERFFLDGCAHLLGRRCTANFGIQFPTWRSGFARVVKAWLDEARAAIES